MKRAELLAALPNADALIIRSASKIDAEALAAADQAQDDRARGRRRR